MLSTDYARIERAIRFLDAAAPRQPSLTDIASHVGLSDFHFQRLFSRWAGISPKRFLQVQTLEYARQLLDGPHSVLDAAYETGMSSGSRLHDLFVSLEAVTPGEYRAKGLGVHIDVGFHDTPFGECLLAVTPRGVCGLTFLDGSRSEAVDDLAARWPGADIRESHRASAPIADRIFGGAYERRRGSPEAALPLLVRGTNFQVKVWTALLRIPAGRVATYEDVATATGSPSATRAAGTAVGRNPIAWLIPCHRVIRSTGALGGYRWGGPRKRAMLAYEASERVVEATA